MSTAKTKKQLILDYREVQGLQRAGVGELRSIQAELRRHLGPGHRTSLSYVANVLRQAGTTVEYDDPFVDPPLPKPYANRLEGLVQFTDLTAAEASLKELDAACRQYGATSDQVGVKLVRTLALKGKRRAESLATNRRVSAEKRQEKQEIASWFRVWLETPDLFADWLELRKRSDEFQRLFGGLVA